MLTGKRIIDFIEKYDLYDSHMDSNCENCKSITFLKNVDGIIHDYTLYKDGTETHEYYVDHGDGNGHWEHIEIGEAI